MLDVHTHVKVRERSLLATRWSACQLSLGAPDAWSISIAQMLPPLLVCLLPEGNRLRNNEKKANVDSTNPRNLSLCVQLELRNHKPMCPPMGPARVGLDSGPQNRLIISILKQKT
jgi:hypothetical protein